MRHLLLWLAPMSDRCSPLLTVRRRTLSHADRTPGYQLGRLRLDPARPALMQIIVLALETRGAVIAMTAARRSRSSRQLPINRFAAAAAGAPSTGTIAMYFPAV